jgi:hypothetical protein
MLLMGCRDTATVRQLAALLEPAITPAGPGHAE